MTETRLPPIGYRPESHTRQLPCGHLSGEKTQPDHQMCSNCYAKMKSTKVAELEAKYDLVVKLDGSPKEVAWAREIRAMKVDSLAQTILSGSANEKQYKLMDDLRTQSEARWFINSRTKKTKAFAGKKKS